jgi:hypothetical protein
MPTQIHQNIRDAAHLADRFVHSYYKAKQKETKKRALVGERYYRKQCCLAQADLLEAGLFGASDIVRERTAEAVKRLRGE